MGVMDRIWPFEDSIGDEGHEGVSGPDYDDLEDA